MAVVTMGTSTHVTEVVQQQQTAVVVPPPAPPSNPNQGCDCSIPRDASPVMSATRCLAIFVIVLHVIALLALGFLSPAQWVASLCGIISGGVLLCCYNKCIYTCTPIFYIFVAVFDVLAVLSWIVSSGAHIGIIVVPALALVVTIPAIILGCVACCKWDAAAGTIAGPQASVVAVMNAPSAVVVRDTPQAYLHA